ncbi:MAG: class I SAM-dependent methyltransferase [Gammaproteobacteria bacterium]|nr:class I SAM-dependent methyltransferase [Gammaproteobacteria bacterium]
MRLPLDIDSIKGFLDPEEGSALYRYALEASVLGPCLEIGSYCGKSTIYLGQACKETGQVLFALDHHRGSEEHQPGEEYHDPALFDDRYAVMDSFPLFRKTISEASLEDTVVPVVARSNVAARAWKTPLAMVFIDGGHSLETAVSDFESWSPQLLTGGLLAIHDIFPDPDQGGQAPYIIWKKALASGLFQEAGRVKTLGVLKRL